MKISKERIEEFLSLLDTDDFKRSIENEFTNEEIKLIKKELGYNEYKSVGRNWRCECLLTPFPPLENKIEKYRYISDDEFLDGL